MLQEMPYINHLTFCILLQILKKRTDSYNENRPLCKYRKSVYASVVDLQCPTAATPAWSCYYNASENSNIRI